MLKINEVKDFIKFLLETILFMVVTATVLIILISIGGLTLSKISNLFQ